MNTTTAHLTKVSISTVLRDELESRGIDWTHTVTGLGMRWIIEGESLTMREAADKFLPGGFDANI